MRRKCARRHNGCPSTNDLAPFARTARRGSRGVSRHRGRGPTESGAGDDMVMVELGIALEGLTKLRDAERIVDIPPFKRKSSHTWLRTSGRISPASSPPPGEEEVVPDERRPVEVQVREQPAQAPRSSSRAPGRAAGRGPNKTARPDGPVHRPRRRSRAVRCDGLRRAASASMTA